MAKLCEFFEQEIQDCFDNGLMMSLHMKATMMKVSDPIIFGHCVKVYFKVGNANYGCYGSVFVVYAHEILHTETATEVTGYYNFIHFTDILIKCKIFYIKK